MSKQDFPWLHWPQTQVLIGAFAAAQAELRFVGGGVRDSLLGKPAEDIDAATPMVPQEVMALLQKANIKAIPTGLVHGTVTAVIDGRSFEITTLRRDVSTDGRHAVVAYTDDWQEDAARRDFTINALYLSPGGELFDYFGGREDLQAGRVRFIGKAAQRIAEDYLRILRFFRFHARYGKGEPDAQALAACAAAGAHIDTLSGERIQQEMLKLLVTNKAADMVEHMQRAGLWRHIIRDAHAMKVESLRALPAIWQRTGLAPDPLVVLSALIRTVPGQEARLAAGIAEAWKLSRADHHHLSALCGSTLKPLLDEAQEARIRRWKKHIRAEGAQLFIEHMILLMAEGGLSETLGQEAIALANSWSAVFPVTGDDLITRGIAPGKALGDTLKRLEDAWEESDYRLTREELLRNLS